MLSGTRAFRRDTPVASMNAVLSEEPPELDGTHSRIPPALERVVRRCLEKQPDNRFQSAKDLAFAIENTSGISQEKRNAAGLHPEKGRRATTLVLILSFTLLGLLAGLIAGRLRIRPPTHPASGVRYLTHSGRDFSPSASPDGKRICFTSDRDGTNRIWLKDLASASERPLTSGPDDSPRFSPDGSAILFTRVFGFSRSLFRVPFIGGEPFRIVDDVYTGDWSPDGRQVAFLRWEKDAADGTVSAGSSLHLIAVDGSGATVVARFEGSRRYSYPRWSPDGKKIAVSMHPSQSAPAIAVVTIATKSVEALKLPGLNVVSSAVWAPDSRRLIYMQPESAGADSSSATARIYQQAAPGEAQPLAWSPAFGRTLEFLPPNKLIFGVRSPRENLREISLEGSSSAPTRSLTAGNSTDRQPCYSPDGERVIFSSSRTGNLDVWEIHRQSGVIRRLTDSPADDWDPAFSPDGKHLLFSSSRTGRFEIWMANADGTNPRQVTHGGWDCENPAMTPDGAWIVFLVADLQENGIWKIRPDGTEATRLAGAGYGIPEISPDGQHLAYFRDASADLRVLHVLSLETGKPVPFQISIPIQKETIASLGRLRWMPGGKAIAFIGPDERGVNGVYVQDFVPGQDTLATRRPLGGFDREFPAESFGLSPDGQFITLATWEQFFSIMVTEGLPSQ
jgi:Tol biopolymer transport system component